MKVKQWGPALFCGLMLTGCATVGVLNPHYETGYFNGDFPGQKTILVMPVDIKAFKITAGGVTEEMDEWEEEIRGNFETALKEAASPDGRYRFVCLDEESLPDAEKQTLESQQALYKALVPCMVNPLPSKKDEFVYTFGRSFDFLPGEYQADILMFISGADCRETFGRMMRNFLAGVASAAATGVAIIPVSEGCQAYFSLVDGENGEVIWFHGAKYPQGGTFAKEKTVKSTLDSLVKHMPFSKQKK